MKSELVLFTLVSLGVCIFGKGDPGSACTIERTQSSGRCKLVGDCPSVLDDIKHNLREHTRCGFDGTEEIVCCPEVTPRYRRGTSLSGISERKCAEYASTVFEYSPPTDTFEDTCAQKVTFNPNSSPSPRQYPHMALLGFESSNGHVEWRCGATLISDEYVLGAGHCSYVRQSYGLPTRVRLGELNCNNDDDSSPEDFQISAIIPHPDYDKSDYYNDIALFKLDRKVEFNSYKRPACLPTTTYDSVGTKAIFTGWGRDYGSLSSPTLIRQLNVETLDASECNAELPAHIDKGRLMHGIIADTQICAGLRHNIKNFHDSGGPLQVYHPGLHCMYIVIGVSSFGPSSADNPRIPEVYTRVLPFMDWIESVVWKNDS